MGKLLRYSLHAETVMRERKLDPSWIEATVREPDWSTDDPANAGVERRYRSIEAIRIHQQRREEAGMTVKVGYDPVVDAAYIRFSREDIIETEEVSQGIMLDYDKDGRIVGLEVLDARAHLPKDLLEAA